MRHLETLLVVSVWAVLFSGAVYPADADDSLSISRIWKDYEVNNLIQSSQEMSIHVNRSEDGNSTATCIFKHSRAFNASKSTRPAIIFAFYEEIRSFHIAVRVLKERVIDQLRTVYAIKLAVFFRHALDNQVMNDMHPALQALSELAALEDVQVVKINTRIDEQRVIHRLNNATRSNVFFTHRGPLFVQFAQRYLAGIETRRLMEDCMAHGERVEFVFFLRTDVVVPYLDLTPLLNHAAALNASAAQSLSGGLGHEFAMPAYVYVPQDEDWGGLNDRFALFSACGFHLYAAKYLDIVMGDLERNSSVQGELQHLHVLDATPAVEIRRIPICYGVFRRFNCQWAYSNPKIAYGQEDCRRSGIPHPTRYNFTFAVDPLCETDNRLKDGDLVRSGSHGDNQKLIYLIVNGTKCAIRNGGVLVNHGWSFYDVKVSPIELSLVPDGPNIW